MNSQKPNITRLDAIAIEHLCEIEQKGDRRIYTSPTLTGCDQIYRGIRSREESEAIEIRQKVGNRFLSFHPTAYTVWR